MFTTLKFTLSNCPFTFEFPSLPFSPPKIFSPAPNFAGHTVTVSVLPWAHYVLAEPKGENATETDRYHKFWGYEMEVLWALQRALGFDVRYTNPVDEEWGRIRQGRKEGWKGQRAGLDTVPESGPANGRRGQAQVKF